MTDRITYRTGAIEAVVHELQQWEQQTESELQGLVTTFRNTFANDWQGKASVACEAAQRKWESGMDEIRLAFQAAAQKLSEGSQAMNALDNALGAAM
jgi:WXG100 family type VII secretion target